MKEHIANRVHEFRTRRGFTQEELAEKVDVSRQTIIAIEKGNYTPSVLLALKIAKAFREPVEQLFTIRTA
jgi:putative transcriptional regulator